MPHGRAAYTEQTRLNEHAILLATTPLGRPIAFAATSVSPGAFPIFPVETDGPWPRNGRMQRYLSGHAVVWTGYGDGPDAMALVLKGKLCGVKACRLGHTAVAEFAMDARISGAANWAEWGCR